MRPDLLLISLVLFVCCASCGGGKKTVTVSHGFYFWKSSFDERSDSILTSNKVDVVYHRLFDLEWAGESVMPTNDLYSSYYPNLSRPRQFIPVIYIENEVFMKLSEKESVALADKIYHRIRMYFYAQSYQESFGDYDYQEYSPEVQIDFDTSQKKRLDIDEQVNMAMKKFTELQLDCDWTPKTKQKYFKFLEACKKRFPNQDISCTIRLYPYKYQTEMGVPPVDRGMLMCYNINDVRTRGKNNSIFDLQEAMRYLSENITYPIPLDYALPMFSWVAIYENDKLAGLMDKAELQWDIYPGTLDTLEGDPSKGIQEYKLLIEPGNEVDLNGKPVRAGSIIRVEEPSQADVMKLAERLNKMNTNPSPRVVLYHFEADDFLKNEQYVKKLFRSF